MGYNLYITRKEFACDEEGPVITLHEWLTYVSSDPEIEGDPQNPGPENYVITSHPARWPLWWSERNGHVYTKNPDDRVIAKLVEIAKALDSRVLGDDEEIYGVDPSDPSVVERR